MPTFTYEGRDQQGNRVSGTVDAAEQSVAVKQLHESGYFITGMSLQMPGAPARDAGMPSAPPRPPAAAVLGVNARDLSIFFRDLYQMLHAGMTLGRAMDLLGQNASSMNLRTIARAIVPALTGGGTFADQLRRYPLVFSPLIVGLITAGEEGGFLDRTCLQISQYLERDYELQQRIKREMFYPKCVVFLALVVGAVVPAAPALLTGNFGPEFLKQFAGQLMSGALPLLVVGGLWFAYKFRLGGATVQRWLDEVKLLIPGVGNLVRKIALARFCRALASLYSAGMGFGRALRLASDACGNEGIATYVRQQTPDIERGGRLSDLMRDTRYFTPMVLNMMAVGEETGDIDGGLNKVADYYEMESETALRAMAKVVGFVALGVVGIMVAKQLLSFYTGYFSNLLKLADPDG